MSADGNSEGAEYGLVMPFIVCDSEGGPYQSRSFVAGYTCGAYDEELRQGIAQSRYVMTGLLPQLDLIAMRHGYVMTSEPWEDDPTQSLVEFARANEADR